MTRLGDPRLYDDLPPVQRAVALALTGVIGLVALVGITVSVFALVA
jgi:hypothetical protein